MTTFLFSRKKGEAVIGSGAKVKDSQFFCLLNGEHYRELQREVGRFVEEKIRPKEQAKSNYAEKLAEKLKHEQRALIGHEQLLKGLLEVVGDTHTLEERGKELEAQVKALCLEEYGESSSEKCRQKFLEEVEVPEDKTFPEFYKQVYMAEKERWWTDEVIYKGKRLAQLDEAAKMARAFQERPAEVREFIQFITEFQETYREMGSLPHAIVPQNGHPFNFFKNCKDEKTSMLDLEDMS